MSQIEVFIKNIRERIDKSVEEILTEANEKAKAIIEEASSRAESLINKMVSEEVVEYRREVLSEVELELRKELLKVKNEIIEKINSLAEERIKEVIEAGEDYYNKIFYNLLKEACEKLGEVEVIVQANERDLEWLSKNKSKVEVRLEEDIGLPIKVEISDSPIKAMGGVIVYSKDGRKYYINTIESRLNAVLIKYRNNLGKLVKQILRKYGIEGV